MGKSAGYLCSFCSIKFSKKWNAKRHNIDMHKGLPSIGYQLKKGINALNKPSSRIARGHITISKFKPFDHNFENNAYSFSPFKSFNNNHLKKKSKKSIFYMDEQEKEYFLYRNLEQMSVPFEKLEKLFVEAPYLILPSNDIKGVLSSIIIAALRKPYPVIYVQNKLALYTRLYCRNKLIFCFAKSADMDVFTAPEYLKGILSTKSL
jgi:hypothetical protein